MRQSYILTRAEMAKVLRFWNYRNKCPRHMLVRTVFKLATSCGLRCHEITGLRMRDVCLSGEHPHICVPPAIAKRHKGREVPADLDDSSLADFRWWHDWRTVNGAKPDDRYLCVWHGPLRWSPLSDRSARQKWKTAVACLGPERQRETHLHCGRHTFASHLIAAGCPLPQVQQWLGHASIAMTSVYTHVVVDGSKPAPNIYGALSESA